MRNLLPHVHRFVILKATVPQLNPPSHFTQLSCTEPSKLCSFPRFPEKPLETSNPSQSERCTRQLLQEVPQFLFELAWLQLEPRASAIPTAARHCTTSPLNSKVVIAAYKHHEGTSRVKTSQKDFPDSGLPDNPVLLLTRVKTKPSSENFCRKATKSLCFKS